MSAGPNLRKGSRVRVVADSGRCGPHEKPIGATGAVGSCHDGKPSDDAFMWREDGARYYCVDLDAGGSAYFWIDELERE